MNHTSGRIGFWTVTLCLLLVISIVTPFANSQSTPGSANPSPGSNPKTAQPSDPTRPTAAAPPSTFSTDTATAPKAKSGAVPSDQDIAAAKAAGKVWVNTETGIYHKSGRWYGKTKKGKFMTETDAKAAGYKAAK